MTRVLAALVALALALPAAAVAQAPQTTAPPGNSAIDEYLETVPGAAGDGRPRTPQQGGGALTPTERARLERLGPDGRALADAVEATPAPRPSKDRIEESTSDGRPPASELLRPFTGSDGGSGMGLVLPAIMIAALLAAISLVLLRRRAAS